MSCFRQKGVTTLQYDRFSRDELAAHAGKIFTSGNREYLLGGKLGDGAIGVVRRAIDRQTQKQFAVKFLAPEPKYIEIASIEDIYMRFKREGLRGAALSHDHLVKVITYEENENAASFLNNDGPQNPFIIMEYIHGTTLENFIKKRANKASNPYFNIIPQTLFIAYSVINALHYLHSRKIVHRDVKPANIYLTKVAEDTIPLTVKLGDFGIVKWGDFKASLTSGTLTVSGQQNLGTLKYMSPEQALKPKEVDVRSDMYALGITLFELFTTQTLPNIYYVLQLAQQRMQRSTVMGKLNNLGLGILQSEYEDLFTHIYDMFATAPNSRPSSRDMEGRLQYLLDSASCSHLYMP